MYIVCRGYISCSTFVFAARYVRTGLIIRTRLWAFTVFEFIVYSGGRVERANPLHLFSICVFTLGGNTRDSYEGMLLRFFVNVGLFRP